MGHCKRVADSARKLSFLCTASLQKSLEIKTKETPRARILRLFLRVSPITSLLIGSGISNRDLGKHYYTESFETFTFYLQSYLIIVCAISFTITCV